ncbi:hypothetical protein XELAEV_18033103mg [Xenopus laevis]|uniref:Uncharacterized protein n=1 Tax=Xenopus laevis TaxID=8355 RepID=A0A974CJC2_XENLA|nr:hypothetical protein XELAEV_18033103mg [Xenopus laevis]
MRHLNSTSDAPLSSTALSPAVITATVDPPVVPPLYPKYGVIHRNSFKPLGRSCIPFNFIPQTANAGVWSPLPYHIPPHILDSMWRIDGGSKSDRL